MDTGYGRYSSFSMNLSKWFVSHVCIALVILAAELFPHRLAMAAEPVAVSGMALLDEYAVRRNRLEHNQFGIPLDLESQEGSGSFLVDVYGIFDYPYDSVRDVLQKPNNWCDINLLLINVKACTSLEAHDRWLLTVYSGRKYYQLPDDAYKLDLNFRIVSLHQEYFDIELAGKKGPLGTSNHLLRFEAAPLDNDRTFIHFRYNYSFGVLARAAMASYYATIGRSKKGFSVTATDRTGNPVYVNGARGSLERAAVRSYFAIQTYLDALQIPSNQRFEERISRWYDLTARFPRQLYEMDKGEYLATKRREHANQRTLQRGLESN